MGKDAVPGPGQYKVPCRVADVPRYSYPARSEEFKYVWWLIFIPNNKINKIVLNSNFEIIVVKNEFCS